MLDRPRPSSASSCLSSRTGTAADTPGIEAGWQSGGGMMTKEVLGSSGIEPGHPGPGIANDIVLAGERRDAFFRCRAPSLVLSELQKTIS